MALYSMHLGRFARNIAENDAVREEFIQFIDLSTNPWTISVQSRCVAPTEARHFHVCFPFFFARWRTKRLLLGLAVQGHRFDRARRFMTASSTAVTPAGISQFEDALWHWTYSLKFLLRNLFKRTSLYSGYLWVRKEANLWPNHSFRGCFACLILRNCCEKQCYLAVISCFPRRLHGGTTSIHGYG